MAKLATVVPREAAQDGWRGVTRALRWIPALVCLIYVAGLADLDAMVGGIWRWMLTWSCCHWAMIEAWVAALSFFSWIVLFRTWDHALPHFRIVPRDSDANEKWLPKVRDVCLAAVQSLRGKDTSFVTSKAVSMTLRVFGSFPVYLAGIGLLHLMKSPRPMSTEPPSFLRVVVEVAGGLWAYDFAFYWVHVMMHRWPNLPHGHLIHHELWGGGKESVKARPLHLEAETVVHHSLVDGAFQVTINILVQNLPFYGCPKHKLSRFIHNMAVTYLLTEAHSGLDLPWGSHRVYPKLFGGSLRHEVHHHLHRCCFQQYLKYLDDMFGSGPPLGR